MSDFVAARANAHRRGGTMAACCILPLDGTQGEGIEMEKQLRPRDRDGIREQFRIGCSRTYGRVIWAFLTQHGCDDSWLRCFQDGNLNFAQLVGLLTGLGIELKDLPAMPSLEALAEGGFLCALQHTRDCSGPLQPPAILVPVDLQLLRTLWQDRRWFSAKGTDNRCQREIIINEVRISAAGPLRAKLEELGPDAVSYAEGLERDWADAWDTCVRIIRGDSQWDR